MSDSHHSTVTEQIQQRGRGLLDELQGEATEVTKVGGQALTSLTWLWPIRGLIYTLFREY